MHDTVDIDRVVLNMVDDHIVLRRDAAVFGIGGFGQLNQRSGMGEHGEEVYPIGDCGDGSVGRRRTREGLAE